MLQNMRRQPCDKKLPDMYEVPVESGNVVAMSYSGNHSGNEGKQECLANARLIAAAPDLLQACLKLIEAGRVYEENDHQTIEDGPSADILIEAELMARAAVAKVKGDT